VKDFDFDPGQFAPLGAQPIAHPREFFLFNQELLARSEPFVLGNDVVILHLEPPFFPLIVTFRDRDVGFVAFH